jgi:hypothetical protein
MNTTDGHNLDLLGTILGIFTVINLTREDIKALF